MRIPFEAAVPKRPVRRVEGGKSTTKKLTFRVYGFQVKTNVFGEAKTVHPEPVEGWVIGPFMLRSRVSRDTNGMCEQMRSLTRHDLERGFNG